MKRYISVIVTIILGIANCCGQAGVKPGINSISLEIGKTGLIYNLNYDHKFRDKAFGIRIGIGSNLAKYLNAFTIGGGGYYLIGKTSSFLELGSDLNYLKVSETSDDQKGFALVYPDYSTSTYYANFNVGYRKYTEKTLFRIGFSPGFINDGFVPGGYISFGLRF